MMTCIIGYVDKNKNAYMAGDYFSSNGYLGINKKDGKVFERDGMLFGFTSSYRMGQLIQYQLKIPKPRKKIDDHAYMVKYFIPALIKCYADNSWTMVDSDGESTGGSFIVIRNGRLFHVEPDFQVSEIDSNFWSVGEGSEVAYGAIKAFQLSGSNDIENNLRNAINIAASLILSVSDKCQIIYKTHSTRNR